MDLHCSTTSAVEPTDAQLMASLAAGDMAALAALARLHQQTIRAIAFRMTGRCDLADDLTQETFLRLHRSAPTYRPTAAFRTFLYRIIANLCLDYARRPRLAALPEDAHASNTGPEEPLMRQEKLAAVRDAVAALPERQRLAVILHRFEHLNHHQIAEVTGWSQSAVESLLVRAYEQLRLRLKHWMTD